jgi:plasmid stability protein
LKGIDKSFHCGRNVLSSEWVPRSGGGARKGAKLIGAATRRMDFANGGIGMAQLIVRNLPESLIRALERRAARHNRTVEQEHREILGAALQIPHIRSLAGVLASMPNVGEDDDFVRKQSDRRG